MRCNCARHLLLKSVSPKQNDLIKTPLCGTTSGTNSICSCAFLIPAGQRDTGKTLPHERPDVGRSAVLRSNFGPTWGLARYSGQSWPEVGRSAVLRPNFVSGQISALTMSVSVSGPLSPSLFLSVAALLSLSVPQLLQPFVLIVCIFIIRMSCAQGKTCFKTLDCALYLLL